MTARFTALLVAPFLAATACSSPHTLLSAPDTLASGQERLAAYASLRPTAEQETVILNEYHRPVSRSTDFMVLGDGQRVHHAEDLAAVVEPDSPTARAAARSREYREKRETWSKIGWGVFLIGAAVSAYTFATWPDVDDPDFDNYMNYSLIGMGISGGGFLVGWGAAGYYGRLEQEEKVSAFATYERDLRNRLVLCVDGLNLVACAP